MSDIATTAKNARESLARGLSALQSDPTVPPQVIELATPIAQAMSALHQIERTNGAQLSPYAETALTNVRGALSQLQAQPTSHPAIAQAMEAVAGSLGLVHAIHKLGQAPGHSWRGRLCSNRSPARLRASSAAAPASRRPLWTSADAAARVPGRSRTCA